jgi:hypothetical protein
MDCPTAGRWAECQAAPPATTVKRPAVELKIAPRPDVGGVGRDRRHVAEDLEAEPMRRGVQLCHWLAKTNCTKR